MVVCENNDLKRGDILSNQSHPETGHNLPHPPLLLTIINAIKRPLTVHMKYD